MDSPFSAYIFLIITDNTGWNKRIQLCNVIFNSIKTTQQVDNSGKHSLCEFVLILNFSALEVKLDEHLPGFASAAGSSEGYVRGKALVGLEELALKGQDVSCINYSILIEMFILNRRHSYSALKMIHLFCFRILCAHRLYILAKLKNNLSYFD